MTSLFKFTSLATVVLILGVFSTVNGEVATKSFKHGVIVNSEVGSKFKFKRRDASAGLGVANMCIGLLDGIAQTSDQGGEITEEDLQDLYQAYLEEQKRLRAGKYGNMAESAGIVRGAVLDSIAENPMVNGNR